MPSTASVTGDGDSGGGGVRRATSHKRSVSDLAIQIMQPILKRDSLRGEDLQSLVRLCGKSILYLPSEYAPGSLVLATCLRATAQYLVQHGEFGGFLGMGMGMVVMVANVLCVK